MNYKHADTKMSNRTWDSTIGDGGEYIETPEIMNDFLMRQKKYMKNMDYQQKEVMLDLQYESTMKKIWKI